MSVAEDGVDVATARIVRRWLEFRADAGRQLKEALAAWSDVAMLHVLQGSFAMLVGTTALCGRAAAAAKTAQALASTPAETAHARALEAWSRYDLAAAHEAWDEVLDDDPHDLLALRLQHLALFWQGDGAGMRTAVERRLPGWSAGDASFGFVLGMHGFALEETGDLARAETAGRDAALREPDDLWSIHAVAHVLDTAGRVEEGVAWLEPRLADLADRNPFRGHVAWHGALFALEQGRLDAVLDAYDRQIRPGPEGFYLDVQNAAALLARLEFLGVAVGNRWQDLAASSAARVGDLAMPFTDLHVVLAQAKAGAGAAAAAQVEALRAAGDPVRREFAVPIAEAVMAFAGGEPGRAVDLLLPLQERWAPIGGSRTQRDLFAQLLLVAAVQAGRIETARSLLARRLAEKPSSRLGRELR